MEAKHTLGKWEIAFYDEGEESLVPDVEILDKDGFPIAELKAEPILNGWPEKFPGMRHWSEGSEDGRTVRKRTREEIEATGYLFFAAPDLLAALKKAVNLLRSRRAGASGSNQEFSDLLFEARQKASAAIAKATGKETP